MAASDQRHRARLDRLEREARDHPRLHAVRLVLLVVLGYVYPVLLLLLAVSLVVVGISFAPMAFQTGSFQAILAYFVYLGLVVALGVAIASIFWIELPPPDAHRLGPNDAQPLRAMIAELRTRIGAPPIHHLYLDADLNAGVLQQHRFGAWGPRINHLMIGVPLLAALTPAQLRAVLAHEMGHLHNHHNRFGAWIYRTLRMWEALAVPFRKFGKLRWLVMGWFVRWYAGALTTTTLPRMRLHEYDADAYSAQAIGIDPAASALLQLGWADHRLRAQFIPAVFSRTARDPLPPTDFLRQWSQLLAQPAPPVAQARWLRFEQLCRTPITAAHPCLLDRLTALDQGKLLDSAAHPDTLPLHFTLPPEESALTLLGDAGDRLIAVINARWKGMVITQWRYDHGLSKRIREEPQDPPGAGAPAGEAQWQEVQHQCDQEPPEQAAILLQNFLVAFPAHPAANFQLARLLLAQLDEGAVAHLETAQARSEFRTPALHLLLDYYRAAGRDDEAEPVRRRLEQHERDLVRAQSAQTKVNRHDVLVPHDWGPRDLARLRRNLMPYARIRIAWLAHKQAARPGEKASPVLALECTSYFGEQNRAANERLIAALREQFNMPCAIVILRWRTRRLRQRIQAVCPQPVYIATADQKPGATSPRA